MDVGTIVRSPDADVGHAAAAAWAAGCSLGELEVDEAGGEHDEGEGGVSGVEAVGAVDHEADLGVQSLDAAVRTNGRMHLNPRT